MNADYSLIGERISFYRHRAGLTQEQLAEKCNMSVYHLNRIEKGRKKPSLDVLMTIADSLGITLNCVISEDQHNEFQQCYEEMATIFTNCSSKERRLIVNVAAAIKRDLHNP